MEKNSLCIKINNILSESNICGRCTLRFFCVREYKSYCTQINVEKELYSLLNDKVDSNKKENRGTDNESPVKIEIPSKRFSPSPCASCLGLLQESCEKVASNINNVVESKKYVFEDFKLEVHLPVPIDLRNHLFYLHLKEKLGDDYLYEENSIPSVKDVCKWVIGSQFGKLTDKDFSTSSHFTIQLLAKYENISAECSPLLKSCPAAFSTHNRLKVSYENNFSRAAVTKAMDTLSKSITEYFTMPPETPEKPAYFGDIKCEHCPLYLGGRYNKYSRELPQTPWTVNGERKMESSVQELITGVVQDRITMDDIVFSASGREDVDVRMLGSGRPFVLELINPRSHNWSKLELQEIENEINSKTSLIKVNCLQVITKKDTSILKEGEEMKRKCYKALCITQRAITADDISKLESFKDLKLSQKTPLRVLHRRTLSTREKMIHSMEVKVIDDRRFHLTLETQAGTYVKEFVHSDFGRTSPSLGELLNTKADILELDVEEIALDWPPAESTTS